jgi:hypothetical protein
MLTDTQASDYSPTTAVLRRIRYLASGKNAENLTQSASDERLPIGATRIFTAVIPPNTSTDADVSPIIVGGEEGF